MDFKSRLSGGIGVPEGGGKLLARPEEAAVQNLIKNEISILNIVEDQPDGGGGGDANEVWGRFKADATKITGSTTFTLTASRTSEGYYAVTSTKSAASSGSLYLFGVLVSVSAKAGDGGDGISPFNEFDSYQEVVTDGHANAVWDYNASNGKFYLLGPDNDDVYIHTDSTWTTAPVQVDADGVAIRVQPTSGCLSREGGYVWMSGDGYPIRCMRVSDNTVFNFGGTPTLFVIAATDDVNAMFGSGPSGPRIWTASGSDIVAYDPNIAGESLGAAVITYTSLPYGSQAVPLLFDNNGYLWNLQGTTLYQFSPVTTTVATHTYPSETPSGEAISGSLGGDSRLSYDEVRNVLYCILQTADPNSHIYTYSGWRDLVSSTASAGRWDYIAKLPGICAISYESAQDLLFVSHYSAGTVMRYSGQPKILIDTVTVDDTVGNTSDIERDLGSAYTCFYKSDSTGDYGYVLGTSGGTQYFIKISYNGDAISFSGGGSLVSSVLVPLYEVTGATTANVYLFRSLSPPVYADGEFTVKFIYP